MHMIAHEHISVNGAAVSFGAIEQELSKSNVILRCRKDCLAVIAALNGVQWLAFDEEAGETGHDWVHGLPVCQWKIVLTLFNPSVW